MLAMLRGRRRLRVTRGERIDTSEFTPWPEGALLVGGAVRDALLGRRPVDLDWLVVEPERAARAHAEAVGGPVFPLDEVREHWRVLVEQRKGPRVVHDFVPLPDASPGGLERELRRRDLTINALAARRSGEIVDPTGGLADLRSGTVRMTSLEALLDDAVRPLRAVRFAGLLDFGLEDRTREAVAAQAAAQRAGHAPSPAAERVRDELEAVLLADRAAPTLALVAELGLLATFLPELDATRGVAQGQLHHLDVFEHSLEALHRLVTGFPDSDLALRLATLMHDVGKPPTAGTHFTGRPTFHGHDKLGADMTASALRRLRFGNDTVHRASALVRHHMLPLPGSERGARRFVHRHRRLLPDLLRLMIADREAARGKRASEAGRRNYRLALARVIAVWEETPPPPRLLDGQDVMSLLGLRPGPQVGEALSLVEEAVAVGDVKDRAGAEALLLRYAAAQGWLAENDARPG